MPGARSGTPETPASAAWLRAHGPLLVQSGAPFLFGQTDGFEGLVSIGEPFDANGPFVAVSRHEPVAKAHPHTARLAACLATDVRHDLVGSTVDDFAQLIHSLVPRAGHLAIEVPDSFRTPNRCPLRPLPRGNHLGVRIKGGEPGLLVASVLRVQPPAQALHVLLRHPAQYLATDRNNRFPCRAARS